MIYKVFMVAFNLYNPEYLSLLYNIYFTFLGHPTIQPPGEILLKVHTYDKKVEVKMFLPFLDNSD